MVAQIRKDSAVVPNNSVNVFDQTSEVDKKTQSSARSALINSTSENNIQDLSQRVSKAPDLSTSELDELLESDLTVIHLQDEGGRKLPQVRRSKITRESKVTNNLPENDELFERKEPYDDSSTQRINHNSNRSLDSNMLNKLLKDPKCEELFRHILNSPNLNDEQKLFAIRKQMQQEAEVFELPYNSEVQKIIDYVNSKERIDQIASAEIKFTGFLIKELSEKGHEINSLQEKYNSILVRFEKGLIPNRREVVTRLNNAIFEWQRDNSNIVKNISDVSLDSKNIKVIPRYITSFTNLKNLDISNNHITDISPLSALRNLEHLLLCNNQITDISPLSALRNLEHLLLWNNKITDISPLASLENLEHLLLWNNEITDISSLTGLVKLEKLNIESNQITDISPLAALRNLKNLDIGSNKIIDISPLSSLENLEHLLLCNNEITDISPLAGLVKLERLNIRNNHITDISPLARLVKLKRLNIRNNHITDISPLASLENLEYLLLLNNQTTDILPLVNLAKLRTLDIRDNQIKGLSPLSVVRNAIMISS